MSVRSSEHQTLAQNSRVSITGRVLPSVASRSTHRTCALHEAGFGHLRSSDRDLRRTFERRLRPDNGPSPDGHARQMIGHNGRSCWPIADHLAHLVSPPRGFPGRTARSSQRQTLPAATCRRCSAGSASQAGSVPKGIRRLTRQGFRHCPWMFKINRHLQFSHVHAILPGLPHQPRR